MNCVKIYNLSMCYGNSKHKTFLSMIYFRLNNKLLKINWLRAGMCCTSIKTMCCTRCYFTFINTRVQTIFFPVSAYACACINVTLQEKPRLQNYPHAQDIHTIYKYIQHCRQQLGFRFTHMSSVFKFR